MPDRKAIDAYLLMAEQLEKFQSEEIGEPESLYYSIERIIEDLRTTAAYLECDLAVAKRLIQ